MNNGNGLPPTPESRSEDGKLLSHLELYMHTLLLFGCFVGKPVLSIKNADWYFGHKATLVDFFPNI